VTDAPSDQSHPFADLADFMALPRLSGLALSLDGIRLVTAVAALNAEGTKWKSAPQHRHQRRHTAAKVRTRSNRRAWVHRKHRSRIVDSHGFGSQFRSRRATRRDRPQAPTS